MHMIHIFSWAADPLHSAWALNPTLEALNIWALVSAANYLPFLDDAPQDADGIGS